eukprot:m.104964 g.104964  ORF g.104964 m.104964 type:complete len:211 (-) comp12625_c0_seq1:2255-2887(-)
MAAVAARMLGRTAGRGLMVGSAAAGRGTCVRALSSKLAGKGSNPSPIAAALAPVEEVPFSALSPAQKVVEGTKTGGSVFIIAGGLALAGTFMWSVFRELFVTATPESIRDKAIAEVKYNQEVLERVGEDLQPTGQVALQEYIHGDMTYTRVAFAVFGSNGQAKVNLELKKPTSGGSSTYRYFFVDIAPAGLAPSKRVIISDNRGEDVAAA